MQGATLILVTCQQKLLYLILFNIIVSMVVNVHKKVINAYQLN